MPQCISWCATYTETSRACSRSEPFLVNSHSTLLSPWTSPSLCRSSLISSPRCLFLSWESLNSCARLAWKYEHSARAVRMEVWTNVGFPDIMDAGIQLSRIPQSPVQVNVCESSKHGHHPVTAQGDGGEVGSKPPLFREGGSISRMAHKNGPVTEESVVFDYFKTSLRVCH